MGVARKRTGQFHIHMNTFHLFYFTNQHADHFLFGDTSLRVGTMDDKTLQVSHRVSLLASIVLIKSLGIPSPCLLEFTSVRGVQLTETPLRASWKDSLHEYQVKKTHTRVMRKSAPLSTQSKHALR